MGDISGTPANESVPNNAGKTKPFSVAVVGGGLAGLALTIGLLNQGIRNVKVYEAAHAFGEIGAGIAFGPNSLRACGLLDSRILEGFKRGATCNVDPDQFATFLMYVYGKDSRNGNGKKAGDLISYAEFPGQEKCWTGAHCRNGVHRRYLLDVLVKLVPPGTTIFNKHLQDIENVPESSGGGMLLQFTDGTTATADAVIGCDGIKSRTRDILHPGKIKHQFSGEYGYRALIPREKAVSILGEECALNGTVYSGYNGAFITYPVEKHDLINAFGVRRGAWTSDSNFAPSTREEMLADFSADGWDERLIRLLHEFTDHNKWGIFDVIHDEKYYGGRICILGDAAHASTPNLGAGAGMAIEDAYFLSQLLGQIETKEQIEDAFRAYDEVRRPRTQKVVRESRSAGLSNCFMKEGIEDDFEKLKRDYNDRFQWIWDYDLESALDSAKASLAQA